jgi:trk system potassium uptake protein
VHVRFVLHMLSLVVVAIGAGILVSAGVAALYQEDDLVPLLVSAGIAIVPGMLAYGWTKPRLHRTIGHREGFFVVGAGWVVAMVFGAVPYVAHGTFGPIDALFESMSGFTTTGASVLVDFEQPHGIMFWRSLTHWYGGMGIIVLFLAVLPTLGGGAVRLFSAEAPGPITERLTPRIKDTARSLWLIYLGFSGLQVLVLLALRMPPYEAVTHTFGTMATGGFSPLASSIAAYDSVAIEMAITLFMVVAGINFSLYFAAVRGQPGRLFRDPELRLYLGIMGVATAVVAVSLLVAGSHDSPGTALRHSVFQVVALQTTTGYVSADFDPWNTFAKVLLVTLMFVGGCAGSTAGGMKVVRVLVLAKNARYELRRQVHPRAVLPVRVAGRVIPEHVRTSILGFFFIHMMAFVLVTLIVATSDVSIVTAASASAATLNNIGPGLEVVGATMNYAPLAGYVKMVLVAAMLVGRLEHMAVLVLFTPSFWRR